MPIPRTALIGLASSLVVACGGESGNAHTGPTNGVTPPPGAVAEFTVSPIAIDSFALITPLGNLNPPGHTLPTDHAYYYVVNFDKRPITRDTLVRGVYAPATGTIAHMMQPVGTDWKITFRVTNDFWYYVDHVVPIPGLALGMVVHAGDVIGKTNPGGAIDLGAYDYRVHHTGFVNPKRYSESTLHVVTPWKYFVEPVRSQLYAKQRRHPAADPDARIDFGIAGRLVGDWFHESVPNTSEAMGPVGWPKSIAFVYDYYDPTKVRIAIGGTIAPPGVWGLPDDAPRPSEVTVAHGKVAYRLMYTESTTVQYGLMLVQMLTDDRLKIQVFVGSQARDADFDGGAQIYLR